jgi:hypothetical protein
VVDLKKTKLLVMTASILLLSVFLLGAQCEQIPEGTQGRTAEQTEQQMTEGAAEEPGDEGGELEGNASSGQQQTTGTEPAETTEETGDTRYSGPCGDTTCEPPGVCYEGRCKVPECMTDEDCVDEEPCTVDECLFGGHPNSYCSTDVITRPRNNDGCCPPGADLDMDTDCEPVCGNQRCEMGETTESCEEDCENAGVSGESAPAGGGYPGPG